MNYVPLGIAGAVGVVDGIINPAGGTRTVPHAHVAYRLFVLGAGILGATGSRRLPSGEVLQGRWNPNVAQALVASGAALFMSRVPAALTGGGIAALGMVEHDDTGGGGGGDGGSDSPAPVSPPPPSLGAASYPALPAPAETIDATWSWADQPEPAVMSRIA